VRLTGIACVENADVPVVFNLTVMRNARQGFFDIAVEFDDIFCSAKLDCRPAFLHDGDGDRAATAIVAFACTAGENEDTFMYSADLVLSCDDDNDATPPVVWTMSATNLSEGQHGAVLGVPGNVPGVFQWATYVGEEGLTSNGQPIDKCFWNRAVGLDVVAFQQAGYTRCTLSTVALASDTPLSGTSVPGENGAYPYLTYSVDVWTAAGGLCGENPLNGPGSGVVTAYATAATDRSVLPPLRGRLACGDSSVVACPVPEIWAGQNIDVTAVGQDVTVTHGSRSTSFALPAGYALAGSCCADGCCSSL
jgi:hypothetical protein